MIYKKNRNFKRNSSLKLITTSEETFKISKMSSSIKMMITLREEYFLSNFDIAFVSFAYFASHLHFCEFLNIWRTAWWHLLFFRFVRFASENKTSENLFDLFVSFLQMTRSHFVIQSWLEQCRDILQRHSTLNWLVCLVLIFWKL